MRALPLALDGLFVLEPQAFEDERGLFFEAYNARAFERATGACPRFVQENHSHSRKGVLRGLHYQVPPAAQGKLMRVVSGEIFDVAVDMRKGSATFAQWAGETLSAENRRQLWVPEGFAHGFLVLSDTADVVYLVTHFHAPEHERCIAWNDPDAAVEWPLRGSPRLSARDAAAARLRDAEPFACTSEER